MPKAKCILDNLRDGRLPSIICRSPNGYENGSVISLTGLGLVVYTLLALGQLLTSAVQIQTKIYNNVAKNLKKI